MNCFKDSVGQTCLMFKSIIASVVREKVSREIFLEIFLEQNFGEIIEKFLNKWKTILNKKF